MGMGMELYHALTAREFRPEARLQERQGIEWEIRGLEGEETGKVR